MDRQEHIEGLRLDQLTPADIDYFFRTLARRVPRRVNNQQQDLLKRLRGRVRYLGVALGNSTAKQLRPDDLDGACEVMVAQVARCAAGNGAARSMDSANSTLFANKWAKYRPTCAS